MKVLVAINSCARDVANGTNQIIRETWLPSLKEYGFDYRFLIGVGDAPKEVHPAFKAQYDLNAAKCPADNHCIALDRSLLKGDELLVDAADTYGYLTYKVRESRRWAYAEGYDFIFKIDVDTYLHTRKLIDGAFYNYDCYGEIAIERNQAPIPPFEYLGGWAGYSISRKAYALTMDAPIDVFVEDVWTAKIMHENNIKLTNWKPPATQTCYEYEHGKYNPQWMTQYHSYKR